MIVRALDSSGDWEYGKGRNDYKKDKKAVEQNIATRLNSFLGDCFFDTAAGIDWFNQLGAKDQLALNLAISATILNTTYVTGLTQLSTNLDAARNFSVSYQVSTSFGIVVSTVTLEIERLITEDGDVLTTEDGDSIIV